MEQPTSQPAYVLHSRAYKETSALVDFLTPQGKVRAVLRRARGKGGSLVRPFVPLEVELRGRGELKNVGRLDAVGIAAWLHGDALFSGLYLNELLMRLLPAEAPHPALFEHYTLTLQALADGRALEPLLRSFEWRLLDELGYAFALDHDVNDLPVVAEDSTACRSTRASSGSNCSSPVCSRAANCWPWPRPTGRRPVPCSPPSA